VAYVPALCVVCPALLLRECACCLGTSSYAQWMLACLCDLRVKRILRVMRVMRVLRVRVSRMLRGVRLIPRTLAVVACLL
jgi:hypothetical protein